MVFTFFDEGNFYVDSLLLLLLKPGIHMIAIIAAIAENQV